VAVPCHGELVRLECWLPGNSQRGCGVCNGEGLTPSEEENGYRASVDAKVKASRVTLLWLRIRRRVSAVAGGDDLREAECKSRFDSAYVRRTVAFRCLSLTEI
jgi:hypothetical protein